MRRGVALAVRAGHYDWVKLLFSSLGGLLVASIVANGCAPKSCTTNADCGGSNQTCQYKIGSCGAQGECLSMPSESFCFIGYCGCSGATVNACGVVRDGYATGPTTGLSGTCGDGGEIVDDAGLTTSNFEAGSSGGGGGGTLACDGGTGWRCKVNQNCSSPTTLTGKVFDPAGANPLYNAVVFIPNDPSTLPAITQGTRTCNTCDVPIGDYVAAATTDATGSFTLSGVPTAQGVPVTVQVGKWRRTVAVNIPMGCATNSVGNGTLRLPRSRQEGDLPQMALLTGGCDDMACFLMNIGIASGEFTAPHAGGRVDVYQGNNMSVGIATAGPSLSNSTAGDCTTTSCPLWASRQSFEAYDIALFSCECSEGTNANESPAAYANLRDWLDEGGKVLASHYHYTWFANNPSADFKRVATWGNTGNNDVASTSATAHDVDNTFPKSLAFGQWLGVVGALNSVGTQPSINLQFVGDSVKSVNPPASRWIYDPLPGSGEGGTINDVKYLSFETPVGGVPPPSDGGAAPERSYCGKASFTDFHTVDSLLAQAASVPADCKTVALTPQQQALEFLFFDLAGCVADDAFPPPLPPPPR